MNDEGHFFSCSVDEEMERTNPDEFDPGNDIRGDFLLFAIVEH